MLKKQQQRLREKLRQIDAGLRKRPQCPEKTVRRIGCWYIHLTQAEEAFRCCKNDLGLRPAFQHAEDRVQAHILVSFLSLLL